jgi:hypothetical protein
MIYLTMLSVATTILASDDRMIKEMNSKGYERSGPTPAFDWRD